MRNKVYNFVVNIDWKLINTISQIDRFDSGWEIIEKKEGRSLKQLKETAMIINVGASTRMEGYKMTNEEAKVQIRRLEENRYGSRESTEITDYIETLEALLQSFESIKITERHIMNIHAVLMRYRKKEGWLKGIYKSQNKLESIPQDVTKLILSKSYANDDLLPVDIINSLITWYNANTEIHALIKTAVFMYEFLSSFPFQSGNRRLGRLIPLLLLLKSDYKWIQYASLEHEIETRREEYTQIIRNCQNNAPNENITDWILFFLDILLGLQKQLSTALKRSGVESRLSPREKAIIALIANNPGSKSGEIADKLNIPNPTTKRLLANLLQNGLIERYGSGRGTNYSIE